jgi:hypothetical protein
MNASKFLISLCLSLMATSALAQWQWIDKDGRKIFSDRPPGSEIPEKNILKRPAGSKAVSPVPAASSETPGAPKASDKPAKAVDSGVDKTLEAKKKEAEAADAAKKKADDEKQAKAKAENCRRARQAKSTYETGVRIARTNAAGEREILDEAGRASEIQRIQSIIDSDCN